MTDKELIEAYDEHVDDLIEALENLINYTLLVAGPQAEKLSAVLVARSAIAKVQGERE